MSPIDVDRIKLVLSRKVIKIEDIQFLQPWMDGTGSFYGVHIKSSGFDSRVQMDAATARVST